MLECDTEIPHLDEPVKLVVKLHFSTKDMANIFRTLVNSQSSRLHWLCISAFTLCLVRQSSIQSSG